MTPENFGKKPLNNLNQGNSTPSNIKDGFARRQKTNSTENLFNLINQTKQKNTMILEPLQFQSRSKEDDVAVTPTEDETIGIGLQNSKMRKTDYGKGFRYNEAIQTADDGS